MTETIITTPYVDIMEENFEDYSMSVILGRAFPALEDGLKPVTRRIIYSFNTAQSDLSKFKKAAFYIGYITSKYHPHGTIALYETIIKMSQDFFKPITTLEAQGNNGSLKDPSSFAAERYVEMRISKFSKDIYFNDFSTDIVPMTQTFDPEVYEPMYLTPSIPTIFLTDNSGIGVGYSVDIPTHNLTEICNATIAKIKNSSLTTKDLMKYINGPDYSCGGMIINHSDLPEIYANGNGKIKVQSEMRAIKHLGKDALEVFSMHGATNLGKIIDEISKQTKPNAKNEPGPLFNSVYDVLELSDVGKVKLIIIPKKDVALNVLENLLYKYTSLRDTQPYSSNIIIDNKFHANVPLDVMLERWITYRLQTIRKVFASKIGKKKERLFIVNALIKCHTHLDAVLKIIKNSTNKQDAKAQLISKYNFADKEAEYIVEQKLYKISSLEINNLKLERDAITSDIDELISIIESDEKIKEYAIEGLESAIKKYGTTRKTKFCNLESNLDMKDLIEEKEFIVALATDGYVYSTDIDKIKHTSRSTKGFTLPDIKKGKVIEKTFVLNNHSKLMCFTEFGRLFILEGYQLDVTDVHISNLIENLNGEKLVDFVSVDENDSGFIIILTENAVVKKTSISDYINSNRQTGLLAFKNDHKEERIVAVEKARDDDAIAIIGTTRGYISKLPVANINTTNRVTKGRVLINFKEEDEKAINLNIINGEDEDQKLIFLISENGIGKLTPIKDLLYKRKLIGKSSAHLAMKLQPEDIMLKSIVVEENDSILITTEKLKTIKIKQEEIRVLKRNAMGSRVIKLNPLDYVKSVSTISE